MILRWLRAAHAYAALWFGLALLGVASLAWGALAVALRAVLPERTGHLLGRRAIARGFRAYLATLQAVGACRFDLQALDALREAGPMILAPNHPSLLDAVMLLSRAPQANCVLKAPLITGVLFGPGARLAGYTATTGRWAWCGAPSRSCAAAASCCCSPKARAPRAAT